MAEYITRLCVQHALPGVQARLLQALDRVAARPGTECVTHGDATLDNALRNSYDEIVWIDPIPPRKDIPSLLGVDLGKLLQSAYGYERVKYGNDSTWGTPDGSEAAVVLDGVSKDDAYSAKFFNALAYLRGLRYFSGAVLSHALHRLEVLHADGL